MLQANIRRAHAIAGVLQRVHPEAIDAIEFNDPQFRAISRIVDVYSHKAIALVVANALVSYRLTLAGEEYWLEFADWFTKTRPHIEKVGDVFNAFSNFLAVSKGNRVLRVQKLNRLQRAARVIENALTQPEHYLDLKLLVNELAMSLKAKPFEKTIVFAAKMAYYTFRVLGRNARLEEITMIPIDKRVALLTVTSGLLDADPKNIMSRYQDVAIRAWQEVARLSNIPLLRLDAIIWLPAKGLEKLLYKGRIEAARDEFARKLNNYSSGLIDWYTARSIAKQIFYRLPSQERS